MWTATEPCLPGIKSPRGAILAVALAAVMGLYGFTTALQKSIAVHRSDRSAVRADMSEARSATAVGRISTLVYAVDEGSAATPPAVVALATPTKAPVPRVEEPAEIDRVSLPLAPTSRDEIPSNNPTPSEPLVSTPSAAIIAVADPQGAEAATREPAMAAISQP